MGGVDADAISGGVFHENFVSLVQVIVGNEPTRTSWNPPEGGKVKRFSAMCILIQSLLLLKQVHILSSNDC